MAASADSSSGLASLVDRHESQETPDGRRDVRYAFAFKNLDWDRYHKHRPVYPQSMYDTWFDYHGKHGGSFGTAHDFASGETLPSSTEPDRLVSGSFHLTHTVLQALAPSRLSYPKVSPMFSSRMPAQPILPPPSRVSRPLTTSPSALSPQNKSTAGFRREA